MLSHYSGEYMIQYVALSAMLFCLVWFATIKILFPFWNLQPVLHPYDAFRHIYLAMGGEPFIIWPISGGNSEGGGIISDKYVDMYGIKTVRYDKISETEKNQITTLLRRKYIGSPDVLFLATDIWLDNFVGIGHEQPSFISLAHVKGGCCVSYPITMTVRGKMMPAYCLELFTVDGVEPQVLFQTHEYGQRRGNPIGGGNVTFFRKEVVGYLGITPFIETQTYLYPLLHPRFDRLKGSMLPANIRVSIVGRKGENAHHLADFLKCGKFDMISCGFSAMLNWIKLGYWYVFVMLGDDHHLLALYFFRDTQSQYENYSEVDTNSRCAELVCSFNGVGSMNSDVKDDLFYTGFIDATRQLCRKINLDFRLIQIPDVGAGNSTILERWNRNNTAIIRTYLAYYFFNYCWKCGKRDVLVLV